MRRAERQIDRSFRRRGAAALATAVLAPTLLAITALGLDIGYIVLTRARLQIAADAGALAAVKYLPTQSNVIAKAQYYAAQNHPGVAPVRRPMRLHFQILWSILSQRRTTA